MEFRKYLELLKKQLAIDLNCADNDFDRSENVITASAANEGRRMYSEGKQFFQMATLGKNTVLSADEVLHPFLEVFIRDRQGHWLFEQEKLSILDRELNKYGYKLWSTHHLYLPKIDVGITGNFTVKWFFGRTEIEPFYDGGRFPNALCEHYIESRPDRIAVCAYDGDNIMGMAGCSEDARNWFQIGVDVFPEYRGNGVGTYLTLLIKNEIIKRGAIPFYGTAPANIHSQNIALNCGFRPAWVEICSKKINTIS